MKRKNLLRIGIGLILIAMLVFGVIAVSGINEHPWDGTKSPRDKEHPWQDDYINTDGGDPWDGTRGKEHPWDGTCYFEHPWQD